MLKYPRTLVVSDVYECILKHRLDYNLLRLTLYKCNEVLYEFTLEEVWEKFISDFLLDLKKLKLLRRI